HALGTERLLVDGLHNTVDAWIVRKDKSLTVLLTNYALPLHPIDTQHVSIVLENAPEPRAGFVERIDSTHANPKQTWLDMGQPGYLNAMDVTRLEDASSLRKESHPWRHEKGMTYLDIAMPPQAVSAITLEFGAKQ
ncbi:MAG: beta-xylosidase, partial [Bryobacteraceae bacterium]